MMKKASKGPLVFSFLLLQILQIQLLSSTQSTEGERGQVKVAVYSLHLHTPKIDEKKKKKGLPQMSESL